MNEFGKVELEDVFEMKVEKMMMRIVGLVLIVAVLGGCAGTVRVESDGRLREMYGAAVKDASVVEPGEIFRDLTAIAPYNDELVWEGDDKKKVLVVTWTSWDGYDGLVGQTTTNTRDIWVTAAPQLQRFCKRTGLEDGALSLRLEQLLGVPPHDGKTKFIEMWVSTDDLFRPCPDPEISDHEAELDFPVSGRFVTVSPEHKEWFLKQKGMSYGPNGYPWTRLGYTYDWGNSRDHVGLSEFVIEEGSKIKIHRIYSTGDYCR